MKLLKPIDFRFQMLEVIGKVHGRSVNCHGTFEWTEEKSTTLVSEFGKYVSCTSCGYTPAYCYGDGIEKPAGIFDFYGSCAPELFGPDRYNYDFETFSLGVFVWELCRGSVYATKRGKVFKRIHGLVNDPEIAYRDALEYVKKQNERIVWQGTNTKKI